MNNKVLVVEDSRAFQNYLNQQLSAIGCQVYSAETLAEAEQLLQQHREFRFAVLDYCLPDAQDGEVIDLVLAHEHKVIVLTATFDDKAREHFIAKGVVDYLLKNSMASVSYLIPLARRLINNDKHHALVVDDSATVRKHVTQLLEHQYIKTTQAEDGQIAIERLNADPSITFVITDHDMPNKDGIAMIQEIRQTYDKNNLGIIGLSGNDSKTLTAQFLKAGANDFLTKPFNHEEFYCRVHQLLNMREATEELYKLANQDSLTGLWNRRYLFAQAAIAKNERNIAMLDIDHFKSVNDHYGHAGGDAALKVIANILKIYFPDEVVARFGGEEFCILSNLAFDDFLTRMENVRLRIERTSIKHESESIQVTVSIGVSNSGKSIDEQIKLADDRLYEAKAKGRNQTVYT